MRPTFERKRARNETESDPASAERDRWRKKKIVMPSESLLAKTRPGLRYLGADTP